MLTLNVQKADVKSLLTGNQISLRADQVKQKRQMMERIYDVIKVIVNVALATGEMRRQVTA